MTTKLKHSFIALLCIVFCILPATILSINFMPTQTADAVIIGPIVMPDDIVNPGIGTDYDKPVAKEWSNSTGVPAAKPNADGSLKSYSSLYVKNDKFFKVYSPDRRYGSVVMYFKVVRTDKRPIYDDDGILDVSWNTAVAADEVVDYAANLYIKTQMAYYTWNGFCGTVLYDKFESGSFPLRWNTGNTVNESVIFIMPDENLNNYGAGPYKNNGINPGYDYFKLTDIHRFDTPMFSVSLKGKGYWENCFWGGCFDYVSFDDNMTGYISRANRNWSNTLKANTNKGFYKGQTAYYSPKAFTVVASNLNNFVKVNGVQATPKAGTDVVPFKDGHHISISNEGITTIEIENGAENVYTPYYCFVDTKLPDVSYSYHNANATDLRRVGGITTTASGAKQQSIYEGVFRDQVQVNFGTAENESPETATYKFNGKTYNLTSETWLSQEGRYEVTVTDLAGNKTISTFDIDCSYPTANLDRMSNDKSLKVSRWWLVNVPTGYKDAGSYSFGILDFAKDFAKQAERNTHVTSYHLDNIDDFVNTHLVASGNTVKVGDYWYYKSINNPELFVYYFDENSLNEAIEFYSKDFISQEQKYKINTTFSPNNYGTHIDDSMYSNIIFKNLLSAYYVNNFAFKSEDINESYKVYYDFAEDDIADWKELQYNKTFASQANTHGLYMIKEIDFAGHESCYFVFLDLQTPMLDIEATIYGKDKTISQTISDKDIPENHELIFYYETFKINKVIEDDKWWIMEVKDPNGQISRYTYLDELPSFDGAMPGVYTITTADRLSNIFTFKVCLLGKAPEAKFSDVNAKMQMKVDITCHDEYNSVSELKIYRNGVCLNSQLGYDEFPDDDTNSLIFINADNLSYLFNKGGNYVVEITDNFGRVVSYEYKFEKDLPIGNLVGVKHNGKTNSEVKFIYNADRFIVAIENNGKLYKPTEQTDKNLTTLTFSPNENSIDNFVIKLIDRSDNENYNLYAFTIKTIKPILNLFGVENGGKTGGTVYALWENNEEQYTASFVHNGKTQEYRKGQILTIDGKYEITLYDEIGNFTTVNFEIDKSIDFTLADVNGNTYSLEEIKNINFDIRIIDQEPLTISMTKNKENFEYEFGLMIAEEGFYEVRLVDEFNNSIFFSFTIDKTPPVATLYGAKEFGKTNKSAWVTSMETNLNCWYLVNDEYRDVYRLGQELTESGKYLVCISDQARNLTTFEFEIDRSIAYDINTYRGGISNGGVRLIAYENLKIYMTKDSQLIEYNFEQILNDEGEYSYTIFDDLGNKEIGFFTIINKKKQNLNHVLQEDIQVKNITKNDENFEYEVANEKLYLHDEGAYKVLILDNKTNKEYSFEITIDTTPPTLEIVGVENGGKTKKVVTLKNVSETPYELIIYVDGVKFEYKLGDEIEKCGRFEILLLDEAGNKTEYSFEREYSLNAASIGVIAGFGVLVILLIILLIKSRHHYYKDEVLEEITETTIEEDIISENDENNDENVQIDENQ